ncbi:ABC transporter permease [Spirochaeta cellobiosiphila]|uniref:ABC transporter permease n=1 Tax=Spirochaeta cellobiosiphila TaxID=504483 RepID=UPI0003F9B8DF|nr:ABC transporter permease [Spirochaeta cellobiosiphila]
MKLNRQVVIGLIAVLLGLLAGAILMLFSGNNPIMGYWYLFRGGLMNVERLGNTIATATTLIMTGLSVAFAFRTGLFNIGTPGQMLIGGLTATSVALTIAVPKVILLPLILVAAIIGGGIWGSIPGLLKARFNVNEVVSSIMMNWVAYWVVYYSVPAFFKGAYLETESRKIPDAASLKVEWLTNLFHGSYINLGLLVALLSILFVWIVLNKTTMGFELKAAGFNRHGAEYAGMNVQRNIVVSMVIAGALSGLAGATHYLGYASNMQIGILPSQGYDGIAVSLLGANAPFGVLASALFFGLLHSGKGFMNAMTDIPPEIGDTIIAIIIYFAATSVLIERLINRFAKRKEVVK